MAITSPGLILSAEALFAHIKPSLDAQRDAAIKRAKDSGSEEAMEKAERIMTGAEVVREIPNAIRDGKRTPVRMDDIQKCERREIAGDKVTVCVKRMLKTRKSAEDDESTISTAFPPDEKYAAQKG